MFPEALQQPTRDVRVIYFIFKFCFRYQTAVKHHNNSAGSKADSIKDELEEAELKVEQCRVIFYFNVL